MKKKVRGIEQLKAQYGRLFLLPWTIGFILFFLVPLIESFTYSFSDVKLVLGGIESKFIGIEHYYTVLFEDPTYISDLGSSIFSFLYKFPFILVLSLIIAIILNQKFRGRLLFRAMYFLPVIIAGGVVLEWMTNKAATNLTGAGVSGVISEEMFNANDLVDMLNLPAFISEYIQSIMSIIMTLIWNSGVQIILFISGMQSIPEHLYEVARVEGATKWETFWFVTFPMLSGVTVLVTAYTFVDTFTSKTDKVLSYAYSLLQSQMYGEGSAMLWIYFILVGALFGIVFWLFNRFCVKRWQ